jgi:hypothetical protein
VRDGAPPPRVPVVLGLLRGGGTMTDAERAARTRRLLALALAELAADPGNLALATTARRLRDVVDSYELVALMHHHAVRWCLYQDGEERRN